MYELSKKQVLDLMVGCGLKKTDAKKLAGEYYYDLMHVVVDTAIKAGKLEPLPPSRPRLERPSDDVVAALEPIALKHVKLEGGKLKVVEMREFLPEMARAGIRNPGNLGVVERYDLVYQVASRVPPKLWEKQFKMTPQQLVAQRERLEQNERRTIFGAWYDSAARFADIDWIETICMNDFSHEQADVGVPLSGAPVRLQEEILLKMIAKHGGSLRVLDPRFGTEPFYSLIMRMQYRDWSEEFAGALIPYLKQEADNPINRTGDLLSVAACCWPVTMIAEFPSRDYDKLLRFKADIYGELGLSSTAVAPAT